MARIIFSLIKIVGSGDGQEGDPVGIKIRVRAYRGRPARQLFKYQLASLPILLVLNDD